MFGGNQGRGSLRVSLDPPNPVGSSTSVMMSISVLGLSALLSFEVFGLNLISFLRWIPKGLFGGQPSLPLRYLGTVGVKGSLRVWVGKRGGVRRFVIKNHHYMVLKVNGSLNRGVCLRLALDVWMAVGVHIFFMGLVGLGRWAWKAGDGDGPPDLVSSLSSSSRIGVAIRVGESILVENLHWHGVEGNAAPDSEDEIAPVPNPVGTS
ncbi:hypothetical protein Syun_023435 [Stephania yunnanensis]|uniref:Uncharacterized protein n=1 Tax=Stephania yunnanensis TaxID=152371 RepID=A0AAP0FP09_9MAGN